MVVVEVLEVRKVVVMVFLVVFLLEMVVLLFGALPVRRETSRQHDWRRGREGAGQEEVGAAGQAGQGTHSNHCF